MKVYKIYTFIATTFVIQ